MTEVFRPQLQGRHTAGTQGRSGVSSYTFLGVGWFHRLRERNEEWGVWPPMPPWIELTFQRRDPGTGKSVCSGLTVSQKVPVVGKVSGLSSSWMVTLSSSACDLFGGKGRRDIMKACRGSGPQA